MAIEADVVSDRPTPELVAGDAVDLAQDVPEGDVDAADGRTADNAGSMPKMLAVHHLPEVLDARGVLADEELADVLDGADHRPSVPFQRSFAPAEEARLIGTDFHKDPIPHAGVTD